MKKYKRIVMVTLLVLMLLLTGCFKNGKLIDIGQLFDGEDKESEGTLEGDYNQYSGPVLSLQSQGTKLIGKRQLAYEFNYNKAKVLDSYQLTHNEMTEVITTLSYPIMTSLMDLMDSPPIISVDHKEVPYDMVLTHQIAGFTEDGMNLANIGSYENLQPLLEGDMTRLSLDTATEIPVTLYTVTDVMSSSEDRAITLAFETQIEDSQSLMSIGFNGGSMNQNGDRNCSFFVSSKKEARYVVVIGPPLKDYRLQGYTDGGCDQVFDGVTAQVTVSSTTLSQVLPLVVHHYNESRYGSQDKGLKEAVLRYYEPYQILVLEDLLMGIMDGDIAVERHSFMALNEMMTDAMAMERFIYLTWEQSVGTGESVSVAADYIKLGSFNYNHKDPYLFDVAYNLNNDIKLSCFRVDYELGDADKLQCNLMELEKIDTGKGYSYEADVNGHYFKVFVK